MTEHATQLEHALTTEAWKQWEGQTVNGEFPLHRYLGGSSHSAVFLTSYAEAGAPAQAAAIKLVPDEPGEAERQLGSWTLAGKLSHPNLLRFFQAGRCQMDGVPVLFVVTECADEDLSQIIPQRALTASEAREMLRPALDALTYLHGMGLAHGRMKPANIMACGEQVKLSIDGICRAGEPTGGPANADTLDSYSPPERKQSPAGDSWALGMTLVEVLTQHLPAWERSEPAAEPVVPETLGQPFLQIVRRCLRRNPALRLKASDIASRLEPVPQQEALPEVARVAARPEARGAERSAERPAERPADGPTESEANHHYLVWGVAIALLLAAIMVSSSRLKHPAHARHVQPAAVEKPNTAAPVKQVAAENAGTPAVSKEASTAQTQRVPAQAQAQEQPLEQGLPQSKKTAPSAAAVDGIQQVLPDVPQKAQATIRGTVRVSVKVSVDPSGRVAEAELDSPGPSAYFANLALRAARQWTFSPAKPNGTGTTRDWVLHFAFSSTETRARAVKAQE
jgi:TonB family protein